MASGKTPDDKKEVTTIELLNQSTNLCSTTLFLFRDNHDRCVQSGFFSQHTISEIDSCAKDFRVLGLETATLAKTVSNQWLDCIILFYKHISEVEHSRCVEQLQILGAQAKELGLAFKVIAAWSRHLGGRIHQACSDTTREATDAVTKYKQLVEDELRKVDTAKANLNAEQGKLNLAEQCEHKWTVAMEASSWTVIGAIVSAIGLAIAEKAVASATAARNAAEQKLVDEQRKYNAAETQEKKAEIIAGKAVDLVKALHAMEATTNAIAAFWTQESDVFVTQSQKMVANETHYQTFLLDIAATTEDIPTWEKAKSDFDRYAHDMEIISNLFNFTSEAKEVETQELKLSELDMKLSIPSAIDVKKIMDGGN